MKILITAIGRRVQLISYLKKNCFVVGVDSGDSAPAIDFVDKFYKVPKYNEEGYIETLVEVCRSENIDFLIPLYEKEFTLLCEYRESFREIGTILLLSSEDAIKVCNDKWNTYLFFKEKDINTPKTYLKDNIPKDLSFPVIIKPADGMASSNVFKVKSKHELDFFIEYVNNPIIQEYVEGQEYTIDTLSDLNGNVISAVPRLRVEVRSGEVSKSRTVKHERIIKETVELCNKLKLIGPGTVQCIETEDGDIRFIEINPRFGGGVPLTFEAGIDYGKYFIMMKEDKAIDNLLGEFRELSMLRYDLAIFK